MLLLFSNAVQTCPSLNLTVWNDTNHFLLPLAPMLMSPLHFSFSMPATAFLKRGFRASPLSEELKCSAPRQLPSCHFLWLFLEGLRDCPVTSSPESILETWHLQSSAPPSIRSFPSVGQLVVLEVFWAASILILMFFSWKGMFTWKHSCNFFGLFLYVSRQVLVGTL